MTSLQQSFKLLMFRFHGGGGAIAFLVLLTTNISNTISLKEVADGVLVLGE